MLADEEIVEQRAADDEAPSLVRLATGVDTLDVLSEESAASYWQRSDRFDMVLDLSFARPGLDAFCRVLEAWVRHFLRVAVRIEPVRAIRDEHWAWHIGLDAEASIILDDLYHGLPVEEDRLGHILALFRLTFIDRAAMRSDLAGQPVYLGLATTPDRRLRLKPQNLLTNLPLASPKP